MLLPCSVLTDVLANNGFYKVGSTQQHIFLNNQVQGIEVYSSKHRVLAQVLFWMKRNLNFFLKQLLSIWLKTEIVRQKAITTKCGGSPFQVWGCIVCNIVEQKTSRIKAMLRKTEILIYCKDQNYFFILHAQRCVRCWKLSVAALLILLRNVHRNWWLVEREGEKILL